MSYVVVPQSVSVDGVTIDTNANGELQIKDLGVISDKITVPITLYKKWDLTNSASESKNLDYSSQASESRDFVIGDSGTKLYVFSITGNIFQYTLSTANDISTATYANKTYSSNVTGSCYGGYLDSTGTHLYVLDAVDIVYYYTLSTAWDISTAQDNDKSFNVTAQSTAPSSVSMSTDGLKLFLMGQTNDRVYQYTLSTAFDVTTATYDTVVFNPTSTTTDCVGMNFANNGKYLFILATSGTIYRFTCENNYDISSMTYDGMSYNGSLSYPYACRFGSEGLTLFINSNSTDTIYQYSAGSSVSYNAVTNT